MQSAHDARTGYDRHTLPSSDAPLLPRISGAFSTMTASVQDPSADLRFPIGRFQRPASLDADARARAIDSIAATPARLREAVHGLNDGQLDTEYRPGGWTVRQV